MSFALTFFRHLQRMVDREVEKSRLKAIEQSGQHDSFNTAELSDAGSQEQERLTGTDLNGNKLLTDEKK